MANERDRENFLSLARFQLPVPVPASSLLMQLIISHFVVNLHSLLLLLLLLLYCCQWQPLARQTDTRQLQAAATTITTTTVTIGPPTLVGVFLLVVAKTT